MNYEYDRRTAADDRPTERDLERWFRSLPDNVSDWDVRDNEIDIIFSDGPITRKKLRDLNKLFSQKFDVRFTVERHKGDDHGATITMRPLPDPAVAREAAKPFLIALHMTLLEAESAAKQAVERLKDAENKLSEYGRARTRGEAELHKSCTRQNCWRETLIG